MKFTVPMRCRAIHSTSDTNSGGRLSGNHMTKLTLPISSILYRASGLNNLLINEASKNDNCEIRFGYKLTHIDRNGVAHFENDEEKLSTRTPQQSTYNDYLPGKHQIKPILILGCDGAYSATREAMLRLSPMNFKREYIEHGYKELTIPPTKDGKFAMKDVEALHIWPRGEFMMIALPNPDKSFTCTIFAPFRSKKDPKTGKVVPGILDVEESSDEDVTKYFKTYFPDVMPIMPNYLADFRQNPSCQLVQTRCSPWNYKDKILLMGMLHMQLCHFTARV